MSKKSGPNDGSHRDFSDNKNQRNESSRKKQISEESVSSRVNSRTNFEDPPSQPSKKKEKIAAGETQRSAKNAVNAVEQVSKASERQRTNNRYKDSGSDAHPGGSYCSAKKHEPCGSSAGYTVEQWKQFISQAEAHANGTAQKSAGKRTEIAQVAQSVHIAQNVDFQNAGKDSQKSSVQQQATKPESFIPNKELTDKLISAKSVQDQAKTEIRTQTGKDAAESPASGSTALDANAENQKVSRSGRSFSSPDYAIHQESLDFYQAHKKAFQAADQRFQNLPPAAQTPVEHHEGQKAEPISVGQKDQRIESQKSIHPYFAINGQLAKENSIFNPPPGDYRLTSINKMDFNKHPEALRLDIPESRILSHVPAIGAEQMLHQAERIAEELAGGHTGGHAGRHEGGLGGGLPGAPGLRPGEILDAVEAMMEHQPSDKEIEQTQEEHEARRMIMLLDGKHRGILFPIKRGEPKADGEQASTIPGISKIFLPSGNIKFIREGKFTAKFQLPDIKGIIAKIKSKLQNKTGLTTADNAASKTASEANKNQVESKPVPTKTVVNPLQTGTVVIKDLKPGTAEPEPLASQLIKAQKAKQQEIKKQEGKEPRPESKTGNKDPYQGKLPEIKMSYTKGQQATRDFTNLKSQDKKGTPESTRKPEETGEEQPTRIRDIYAKFDIQLPRKKLKPEITESGTYKIVSNQSSQKMQAVSDDAINAPFETANSILQEGGDPRNPENKPFPKSAATSEEPRPSYTVKQGETVEYISVAELQDASLSPLIREINDIVFQQFYDYEKQQPVSILPAGLLILLPNKKDIIAFRLKVARNRNS